MERMSQVDLTNPNHRKFIEQEVEKLRKTAPQLNVHQLRTENCIGENITESKDCYQCYDTFASEDCFYNIETNANKDCADLSVCFETELSYSCVQSPLCYNCNFLYQVDNSSDSEFCAYSRRLKNCFGCVYLENKEYYILNKPYSPADYAVEVERIKKELITAGQYDMKMFLVSDYEKRRMETETDPVIKM
ncbi:MAG: Epidermal growth factor receptor [Candidatus Peregrinibacteria bacterium GW2011_GWA2_47_7]|nr:MAG: Epidermal growth factor receptor [Candidatus Peregrinibacteria bacterium GW2011_GWA2_47_7]